MENDQISPTQQLVTPPNFTAPQSTIPSNVPDKIKPSNLPIITLTILLLISISVIAYLFTQIQSLKKQISTPTPSTQVTPTSTTTPSPTISTTDQIENWKTYSDEAGQFLFKYPASLVEGLTSGYFTYYSGSDFSLAIGQIENRKSITNAKPFNTLDEYIKSNYIDISDKQTILLDKKEVARFQTQNITRVVFFSIDKKTINIIDMVVDVNHPEKSLEALKLFDQILATFKFVK